MSIWDILKVKRTELVGDSKQPQAFFEAPEQHPDDKWKEQQEADESAPADTWQHYGFVSRLPKNAEALVMRFGQSAFAIASRALAAAKVFGSLGEGDCAMYTEGGNVLRMNKDGSATLLVPAGSKQHIFHVSKSGFKFVTAGGIAVEISDENGITFNAGSKNITFATSAGQFQVVAPQCLLEVGVLKTSMVAKTPLVGVAALAPGAPNVFI